MANDSVIKEISKILFPNSQIHSIVFEDNAIIIDYTDFKMTYTIVGKMESEYTIFINNEDNKIIFEQFMNTNPHVLYTYKLLNTNTFLTSVDHIKTILFNVEKKKLKSYTINFKNGFFNHLGISISPLNKNYICVDGSMFFVSINNNIIEAYDEFVMKILFHNKYKNKKFHEVTLEELSKYLKEEGIKPSELNEFNFDVIQMVNL